MDVRWEPKVAGLPSGGGGALGQATATVSVWEVPVGLLELGQVERCGDGPGAVSRARMWGWVEGGVQPREGSALSQRQ